MGDVAFVGRFKQWFPVCHGWIVLRCDHDLKVLVPVVGTDYELIAVMIEVVLVLVPSRCDQFQLSLRRVKR